MAVQDDGARPDIARVWDWISHVPDPEMPFVSLVELGVVRDVRWDADLLRVAVTPTYSGCPAQRLIADAIRHVLLDHGVERIEVETRLAPPWTTDWIGSEGKAKLLAAGIAPPLPAGDDWAPLRFQPPSPACPYCGSKSTRTVSEFSGTLCKSMHVCDGCLNPFEHFKAI